MRVPRTRTVTVHRASSARAGVGANGNERGEPVHLTVPRGTPLKFLERVGEPAAEARVRTRWRMENPVSTRASPDERTIKCFEVVHNGTRAADSKQDGQGSVAHLNPLPSVCRANALDRVVEPRDWWSNVEGTAMRQLAGAAARITSTSGFAGSQSPTGRSRATPSWWRRARNTGASGSSGSAARFLFRARRNLAARRSVDRRASRGKAQQPWLEH